MFKTLRYVATRIELVSLLLLWRWVVSSITTRRITSLARPVRITTFSASLAAALVSTTTFTHCSLLT